LKSSPAISCKACYIGGMTEEQLREIMAKQFQESLPDASALNQWAKATGLSKKRVKQIYGEVIGDPDPWGMPIGMKNDGQ